MKKLSIGVRLTMWYLAIFALAQLIFGAGMWVILRHHLYDLVDDGLDAQVDDLKSFLDAQKKDASIAKLQEEVSEAYAIEHPGDYLQVTAENNELIYCSAFLQSHALAPELPRRGGQIKFWNRRFGARSFRFAVHILQANGHTYTVEMGVPTDDVVETLSTFRNYLLLFAPLLLLFLATGGYWLSRRALSPMDALVRTARDISGANLSSRLEKIDTGDELQRLSDTLNEMLERIEAAFLRITQFTADASHELRTPLSLIRTEAELALRRSRGIGEYEEALRHILLEAERTTTLIEQMLSLARADSGRETLHMQPVNLSDTLRGGVEVWRQVATIRNLEFTAKIESADLFVMGDQAALRRVADIFLDNAFKYTPPPGSVHLSVEQKIESAVIVVRDSGVGIAEDDHRKIFERFYQTDKARSREQGGAGLGLTIANWIVVQHGGLIEVNSRPGEGATFRITLHLTAAPVHNPLLA
jgi:two-component system, OmpR family, heavy metal sensor histidine kinase CusS